MDSLPEIEECFKKFSKDLSLWLPDGLIQVDIKLLQELGLLDFRDTLAETSFTRYFQVVESSEKITLVNEQFVIWIVPEKRENEPFTYVLIAINTPKEPHLELAFSVSGAYNTSRLVLRILEKYLLEIQENEDSLRSFKLHKS